MPHPHAALLASWVHSFFSVLDVFLQDILWTSHVKMTCQALGLNNRSLEHPSVKGCCEVELRRHPVRSDSLHCSFSFTLVVLCVTAVWPAFARLIIAKETGLSHKIDISLWENTVCMQFAKIIPGLEVDHDTLVLKVLEFNHLWHQKCNPTHWQKNEVFKTVISKEKHIKHIKHLYTAPN